MTSESAGGSNAASPLEQAIVELQRLHQVLLSGDLDPRILADFRDALNRVRTAAWAAQQYMACEETEQDSGSVRLCWWGSEFGPPTSFAKRSATT